MAGHPGLKRYARTEVRPGEGGIGARLFAASRASCHEGSAALPFGGMDLALSSALNAPEPRNMILVTPAGVPAADGRPAGMMPSFDGAISNEDLAALLQYLRAHFSDKAPWSSLGGSIPAARRELQKTGQP
jgi:mono/diheme cytochrome c family protein